MAAGTTTALVFVALSIVGQALSPPSYFTTVDQQRLRSIFEAAQPYGDVSQAYYAVVGLSLLGAPVSNKDAVCNLLKAKVDVNSVESVFFASSASKALGNCKLSVEKAKSVLASGIKEDALVIMDSKKVSTALLAALKRDDSPLSHGYAFHAASELSGDVSKMYLLIEDILAQADEVDEQYLQFEGGLYTTAVVIDGIYKLAETAKKAPELTSEKVMKFANYFLSRRHVYQIKTGQALVAVLKKLTNNKYHIPVAVSLANSLAVSSKSPVIQVHVTNLLGSPLDKVSVTADTAKNLGDNAVVLSKKPMTSSSEESVYELNFMESNPPRGFYSIALTVTPQKKDARLIGTTGAEVRVKVTTQAAIENVEVGVSDKDQSTAGKTTKLQYPNKAANRLEADYHQKIILKFQLRDVEANSILVAHQTFVRLTNKETKQEIVFVAEPDKSDVYRFELDVGDKAKEFGYLSGVYTMDLIVGDAVIDNPFSWTVADTRLTFPEGSIPKRRESNPYAVKPEIEHMFRQPEKRPPTVVSNAFTILVLSPILLLVILWIKLGANISNFPMSLSAVGFHLGLAGIFGLYYCYWVNLSMFTTLRYLGILSIPTFLFGNRLLSDIASRRK